MRYVMLVCAALVAAPAAAQDEGQPADASLAAWQALQKEYQAAIQEYFRPYREARAKGEDYRLDAANHPDKTYGALFREFAEAHKGTEGAAQALVFAMRVGTQEERAAALQTLLESHMASPAMKDVAGAVRYREDGPTVLRAIAAKSPHAQVRGFALLTLAQALKETDAAGALAALETVAKEYGALAWYRGTLGEKAASEIFEVKNLSVGMKAPDVDGEDVDGVAFRLSDYRGKVVLLDFWGDW